MPYVLVYEKNLPDHLHLCINQIKKIDPLEEIYLVTEDYVELKDVNVLKISDIESDSTRIIKSKKIYDNTKYEKNPLWETSLLRIFYLRDLSSFLNLKEIVHFDTDVLIYAKLSDIKQNFNTERFNITRLKKNALVFGYSYSHKSIILENLCNLIEEYLINKVKASSWIDSPENEMKILSNLQNENPKFFNELNVLPSKSENQIFDPATYGQMIGGSHSRPRRFTPIGIYKTTKLDSRPRYLPRGGIMDLNHDIGLELNKKKVKIFFNNGQPQIIINEKLLNLVNLHIHSKELNKYI